MTRRLDRRDIVVAVVITSVLFVQLLAASLLRANKLLASYDLAYFRQAAWLIGNSEEPFVSLRGLYLLGDHAGYIMYPIGWLATLLPTDPLLLVLQAAAVAGGAFLVFCLARGVAGLSLAVSVGVMLAYAFYPALHNINMADFHPEVLAIPGLIGAVYFALSQKWAFYGLSVATVLACREDLAVPVIVLALVLMVSGRRRAGLITAALAIALLSINIAVVMPHFAGGAFEQSTRLSAYGDSIPEAILTMLQNPVMVLDDLTTSVNTGTIIALFGPVLFLAVLSPKWLLPGLPLQLLYMLSTVEAAHTINGQYTVGIIPFVFVATVMALRGRTWPTRELTTALIVSSVLFGFHHSADVDMYIKEPERFEATAADDAVVAAGDLPADGEAVMATARIWQEVAERKDFYSFPMLFDDYSGRYFPPKDPVPLEQRRDELDWIILDTHDGWQWDPAWNVYLDRVKASPEWTLVLDRNGVLAFRHVESGGNVLFG